MDYTKERDWYVIIPEDNELRRKVILQLHKCFSTNLQFSKGVFYGISSEGTKFSVNSENSRKSHNKISIEDFLELEPKINTNYPIY